MAVGLDDCQAGDCIRWHREGFKFFWTRLSRRNVSGSPPINDQVKALIKQVARANPLWGTPRIHGELLKLGIDVSERYVSRLMPKNRKPPSQTWRTFLDNHLQDLVSIDFMAVPTAAFRVLYVLVVMAHDRRRVLHFNVTEHPTAAWTANRSSRRFQMRQRRAFCCGTVTRFKVKNFGGV